MRICIFDIETPLIPPEGKKGLNKIWCIVTKELGKEPIVWLEDVFDKFLEYTKTVDLWVAHNGLGFDTPVTNRILGECIVPAKVIDTFVVSRLVNYSNFNTHSLDELGQAVGVPKSYFKDFSQLSQEMIDYCIQDVRVTEKVYRMYERFIWDDEWSEAMRLEHDMVLINNDMTDDGFLFDVDRAKELLVDIKSRMAELEAVLQQAWPPQLEPVNRIKYRLKGDGTPYKNVLEFYDRYPKVKQEGSELVAYDYIKFNPGSTKDRVEKLWESGWSPVEKSKTHAEFSRDARVGEKWRKTKLTKELYTEKKEYFEFYGWKVNETNLKTLPDDAPEGANRLAEWLTLEGRRSSLEEWLGCVQADSRIHGTFWGIGAWTHRMSHSSPNQANIFSPFHGDVRNAVEQVKSDYDRDLRALWTTDKVLVGTDADGIQLRILCHYLRSEQYREAILNGRKENETDIHNLNRRALHLEGVTRDDAKTFIYAWLLGAGTAKVASILRTTTTLAKRSVQTFVESIDGLHELKHGRIVSDARRGYFVGLDKRKVVCNSEHLMLAGYLQNGEAIAMKRWIREWQGRARKEDLWFRQVDFVHDEVQVEVESKDAANRLIQIQQDSMSQVSEELGLFCPLSVSGDIGYNWAETH